VEEQLVTDFFTEEKEHWWHIAKRALIRQFINGRNLKILVAGIGGGMICKELKETGYHVIGVDISPVSCKYVNKNLGIPVINADLEKLLMFAKESFDLTIIADVLEHMDNERQLLSEVYRCLKPKGTVIITVPAYSQMWSSWDTRLNHKRRYSLCALKKKIIEAGFSVKKISYYHMLLYPFVYVYRKVLCLPKGKYSERSDFAVSPNRLVSRLFTFYYTLERSLLNVTDLPFGLSIFAVGVKRG